RARRTPRAKVSAFSQGNYGNTETSRGDRRSEAGEAEGEEIQVEGGRRRADPGRRAARPALYPPESFGMGDRHRGGRGRQRHRPRLVGRYGEADRADLHGSPGRGSV